jgi:hypothetical protein
MKDKKEKLIPQTLSEVAKDWSIDYQVFKIKTQLVETIKGHCEKTQSQPKKTCFHG